MHSAEHIDAEHVMMFDALHAATAEAHMLWMQLVQVGPVEYALSGQLLLPPSPPPLPELVEPELLPPEPLLLAVPLDEPPPLSSPLDPPPEPPPLDCPPPPESSPGF
jgi:hypothetical protein